MRLVGILLALLVMSGLPVSAGTSIPFEVTGRHMFIDVTVNDEPLCFVFDTGASSTIIDSESAATLGLVPTRNTVAMGSSGKVKTGHLAGNRVTVGEVVLRDIDLVFVPLDHLSRRVGRQIDGILGFDLLQRYAVTVDNTRQRLVMQQPGSYVPDEHARKWPFRLQLGIPVIEAVVTLQDGGRLRFRSP
jgi:hypothetical protein